MQKRVVCIILFLFRVSNMQAVDMQVLSKALKIPSPFNYKMDIRVEPGPRKDAGVMIACHGYGANNGIADVLASYCVTDDHIISFNFPDYDCIAKKYNPRRSTFGSIQELLPLLWVLKQCVVDAGLDSLDLYGFSAGGAAVINALVVLNNSKYDTHLHEIGITAEHKEKIIAALQKGIVILDCPLKSVEEIMAVRGKSAEFTILAERYARNGMRPFDVVEKLTGLTLTILLHFQKHDEILGNRDDELFINRLFAANAGQVYVILTDEGGHNAFHKQLWQRYKKIKNK